jgi:hypothetical protein
MNNDGFPQQIVTQFEPQGNPVKMCEKTKQQWVEPQLGE